jgi:crotonobetainyl-CoA:carnitine CoA-transferase CaiB-like acyl-CoA transferase
MLNDLKVLELASVLAGPGVGQFFAEAGAEVIKVENIHTRGDVTRTWRVSDEITDDRSSYFCAVNWGKKSIAVDLQQKEGQDIVCRLAQNSDVVISSYKSGDAKKLGVDFQTLSPLNPRIIYGQITGFGAHNSRVGYDAVIQAEAGFMFMNGEPGGSSLKMPVALMDILAAHHLKEGILLALLERNKTGRGNFVHVSLFDAAVASLANQASNWLVGGVIPQKQGSLHPNISPYGDIFRTADGIEILLAVGSDRQFASLCEIVGLESGVLKSFSTNPQRVKNRADLNKILQSGIEGFLSHDLIASIEKAGIPYGLIRNIKEVFETPEAQALLLQSKDRIGVRSYVGATLATKSSHFLPPPHFGEHTAEILQKSLGFTSETLKSLFDQAVIA